MHFTYTIDSKVETLMGDGSVSTLFHGGLNFEFEGHEPNPQRLALPVPREVWDSHFVGDVLVFPHDDNK